MFRASHTCLTGLKETFSDAVSEDVIPEFMQFSLKKIKGHVKSEG